MNTQSTQEAPPIALFQHTLRHDWGLATPAYDQGGVCIYQFEDGKTREFRPDSPLLRPVAPSERNREAVRALRLRLRMLEAQRRQRRTMRRAVRRAGHALEPQVRVLLDRFPQGFGGDAWLVKMRGHGARRRLKRHRTPAILGAQQRLDALVVDGLLVREAWAQVVDLVVGSLAATNLVTASQLRALAAAPPATQPAFAIALRMWLYGDAPFDTRFQAFVEACELALGRAPSWELVTAPAALVFPTTHLCMHPKAFAEQARRLDLKAPLPLVPGPADYRHYLAVARGVEEACRDHRLRPRDLFDVRDFVQLTLTGGELERVRRGSRQNRRR